MENEQPIPLVTLDPVSGEYIALLKARQISTLH